MLNVCRYIHGDHREAKFNAGEGIFMLHLRSACAATAGAEAAFAVVAMAAAAASGEAASKAGGAASVPAVAVPSSDAWVGALVKAKGWAPLPASLGTAKKMAKDIFCEPFVFDVARPWNYELTDAQLLDLNKLPDS